MSADKPVWLEEWRVPDPPAPMTCVYSDERNVALLVRNEDARLIAAAPALVRALLAVEWEGCGHSYGEYSGPTCGYCDATAYYGPPSPSESGLSDWDLSGEDVFFRQIELALVESNDFYFFQVDWDGIDYPDKGTFRGYGLPPPG